MVDLDKLNEAIRNNIFYNKITYVLLGRFFDGDFYVRGGFI